MPVAALIALIEGVLAEVPQAIDVFNQLKAMAASGTEPTADEWTAMIGNIDAANAAVQAAEPPSAPTA